MKKIKHSKFKNTGFIFELLVRQITSEIMSATNSTAERILKEHFNSKKELSTILNDPNIEIVKLANGKFKSQSFGDQFISTIQSMTLYVSLSVRGDPIISISASAMGITGPLISIRAKFEAPSSTSRSGKLYSTYMRNYIEAPTKSLLYLI